MRLILATISIFLVSLIFSQQALATALPPNDLGKYDRRIGLMGLSMTEETYNQVISEVVNIMRPYVQAHGVNFQVRSNWADSTVNAYADQEGSDWIVMMFGGLARRPEITADGLSFVVCHEVGHHIAGFPFYTSHWAAAEGQADYFATQVCLKRVWSQSFEENRKAADTVDAYAKIQCDSVWTQPNERNLCYRIANAGKSFGDLIYALETEFGSPGTPPSFSTPDPSQVTETDQYHPASQCRLDTAFQGALCGQSFDLALIPGKYHPKGQESIEAETLASAHACTKTNGYQIGMRPNCWYKSRID